MPSMLEGKRNRARIEAIAVVHSTLTLPYGL